MRRWVWAACGGASTREVLAGLLVSGSRGPLHRLAQAHGNDHLAVAGVQMDAYSGNVDRGDLDVRPANDRGRSDVADVSAVAKSHKSVSADHIAELGDRARDEAVEYLEWLGGHYRCDSIC